MVSKYCPNCGSENSENAEFCVNCGRLFNALDNGKSYTFLKVVGYIFSFLGGLIGFIIAIYLLTRKNANAKKHGKIQLALCIIMTIVWFSISFSVI